MAQEAMRSAETGSAPLVELEQARVKLAENRAALSGGARPVDVLFDR
jgi:hypothetical protein